MSKREEDFDFEDEPESKYVPLREKKKKMVFAFCYL